MVDFNWQRPLSGKNIVGRVVITYDTCFSRSVNAFLVISTGAICILNFKGREELTAEKAVNRGLPDMYIFIEII